VAAYAVIVRMREQGEEILLSRLAPKVTTRATPSCVRCARRPASR
jgi:hypothetical protein